MEECTIDDVKKLDLRVATVLSAEAVEGSEKLLKMQLDLGEEKRQVLSGIAKMYGPEEMVGKQVVFIANLAPRTMMGFESQGMVFCANSETGPVLLLPERQVAPGATIQ